MTDLSGFKELTGLNWLDPDNEDAGSLGVHIRLSLSSQVQSLRESCSSKSTPYAWECS